MKEKLRMILAVAGIFLLLPLLLTVFLSGREALRIKKTMEYGIGSPHADVQGNSLGV